MDVLEATVIRGRLGLTKPAGRGRFSTMKNESLWTPEMEVSPKQMKELIAFWEEKVAQHPKSKTFREILANLKKGKI
jgi:hypothetical protein